jgi:holo-[acyl-carrier protein] synthase
MPVPLQTDTVFPYHRAARAGPAGLASPMRLVGHGVDIVEVSRIAALRAEHGDRFLDRCFTRAELAYAQPNRRVDEHLAARFAAKEAVLKTLGTGLTGGIAWTDIEVTRDPHGSPGIRLTGRADEIARQRGVDAWSISMSHCEAYAVASVIAVSWGPAPLPPREGRGSFA